MSAPNTATGPRTEEGKQRSSRNATKHGFTGQTLILSPDEHEAYQAHVAGFFAEYQPKGQVEINLTQQLADIHFSLNQIFVQQANMMGLLNAISLQMASEGPIAAAGALAPHIRSLNTLNLYDQRRRRAANDVEARLKAVQKEHREAERAELAAAAEAYKLFQSKGKAWVPADSGFVCSLEEVEGYLEGAALAKEIKKPVSAPFHHLSIEDLESMVAESEADLARTEDLLAEQERKKR